MVGTYHVCRRESHCSQVETVECGHDIAGHSSEN